MKRMQNRIRSLEEEVNRLQSSQETTAQLQPTTEGASIGVHKSQAQHGRVRPGNL